MTDPTDRHSRKIDRDELGEIIVDNATFFQEQLQDWTASGTTGRHRDQIEQLRELLSSQFDWLEKAKTTGVPLKKRREWLGQYPETLHWIDLGLKTLEENPNSLKLRPSNLVEAWGYLHIESQRGRNVAIETLFHLTYMASFFTENCHTKQLSVSRTTYGWKPQPVSFSDVVLTYHGISGLNASVDAPIELLDLLTAPRNDWLAGVAQFGEKFTEQCHKLIRAAQTAD